MRFERSLAFRKCFVSDSICFCSISCQLSLFYFASDLAEEIFPTFSFSSDKSEDNKSHLVVQIFY